MRIGVSGWRYRAWRGDFYPADLPQRRELAYAAERMSSVEINGSFYSLQRPTSYESWRDETPDDFVFAVKGGRFITHLQRIRDVEQSLANFFASGVLALGPKLGPVLWQLPETVAFDPDVLDHFLGLLPRTTQEASRLARRHDDKVRGERVRLTVHEDRPIRHALEPRHDSFGGEEALAVLRRHEVACVLAETAGRWPLFDHVTTDLAYVRLHGETELYTSGYTDEALDGWAERVRDWRADGLDVHVYFDNDAHGHAPYDAGRLIERLGPPTPRPPAAA